MVETDLQPEVVGEGLGGGGGQWVIGKGGVTSVVAVSGALRLCFIIFL